MGQEKALGEGGGVGAVSGQSPSIVLERLTKEAVEATNDGARVRALELWGKTQGVDLFRDVVAEPEDTQTPDELLAEVERRLKEAFGKR